MKQYFHAFLMCQSMFCAVPSPGLWDEKARDKMLLFLPVVGLEIGLLWALAAWLCRFFALSAPIAGIILCAYPYLVTGFLHLDGFMDVTDAVRSWRSPQRRREILKDSHVGSFAVIAVCLLILAQFALFSSAQAAADYRILVFIPAVSRACSALAIALLPPLPESQYAAQKHSLRHILTPIVMLLGFLTAAFLLCRTAAFSLLACMVGYGLSLWRANRSLGGMNGDVAGYSLCIGELCAVAVYALI